MAMIEKIDRLLPGWIKESGPEGEVVLSSRIRLARNLRDLPFPHYAGEKQLEEVINLTEKALKQPAPDKGRLKLVRLDAIDQLERMVLLEKHLISPNLVKNPAHRGVILRDDECLAIMINEEDHLRIQAMLSGLQLDKAWELADKIDDYLEASLDYAFDEERGYLTACPTNVGTGLRVSVMVHLPALGMVGQVKKVLAALAHVGLNVRGVYGEGTESVGNLFQISNQVTLGHSEEDLVGKLVSLTRQVVEQEKTARRALLKESRVQLENKVYRAYGLLTQSRLLNSHEAMLLLSDLLLGVEAGLVPTVRAQAVKELFLLIRVAILQQLIGKELQPEERDYYRAMVIREHLK
ncbi:MAG: protein arginine kinase [Firmicutes bacterium]|nr:protein arginine kinase [Bacillota bacterium]